MPVQLDKDGPIGRQHVSMACAFCRRSKTKCDGQRPTCGQCRERGRRCQFQSRLDKRKISLRRSIEHFTSRVLQLEDFINSHGLEVPEPFNVEQALALDELMTAYCPTANTGIEKLVGYAAISANAQSGDFELPPNEALGSPTGVSPSPAGQTASQGRVLGSLDVSALTTNPVSESIGAMADIDMGWDFNAFNDFGFAFDTDMTGAAALMDMPTVMGPNFTFDGLDKPGTMPGAAAPGSLDSGSLDGADGSEVTDEISDRMGGLLASSKGRWHFYGATSNLHLANSRHVLDSARRRPVSQASLSTRMETRDDTRSVPEELTNHLVRLFFTWDNPSLQIVDLALFEQAQKARLEDEEACNSFHSEVLINAICAIGAAFEDNRQLGLPSPLSEFFAKRAKAALEPELEDPRVATVQGLAILSCHEAAMTRDTMAWMFSGMAVRLALDLGLHAATQKHVSEGTMDAAESRARSNTLWGVIVNDSIFGIYLGRPFHTNVLDIPAEKPRASDAEPQWEEWRPYTDSHDPAEAQGLMFAPTRALLLNSWITLHEIMCPLGHSLYARKDATKLELQMLAERTFERLLEWRSSLSADLRLDTDALDEMRCVPHLLSLHLHYALWVIVLHRPFCAKGYIQPVPLVGKGPEHAQMMCIQSAVDISKLLTCYKRRYTLRRARIEVVHVTFTAALILVYAVIAAVPNGSYGNLSSHLDVCCQALADLGEAYWSATRALDILLAVKRSWQARTVANFGEK